MKSEITMASEDICRIIEQCGKTGVSVLKYGPLEISFDVVRTSVESPYPEIENSAEKSREIHQTTILQQEIETKEDMLSRLQIEDPVELEKLIMSGDLNDSET